MKLSNESQIAHGDVLHCVRDSFVSKAIRYVTKSKKSSHTAIVIEIFGILHIVDSQFDGTRIRTFKEWNSRYQYDVIITRPHENIIDFIDLYSKIAPFLNSNYGYIDILRHLILNWFGIWLGTEREQKNLICSEFVLMVFGYKDAYKSNPEDAYIWCLENGFKIIKQ